MRDPVSVALSQREVTLRWRERGGYNTTLKHDVPPKVLVARLRGRVDLTLSLFWHPLNVGTRSLRLSATLEKIKQLVASGDIRISNHGYDELANDRLTARELVIGLGQGILVEDYPNYPKGASVLVLQIDEMGQPVHVVWGIPKGLEGPAVLVTAYMPDPKRWEANYTKRKP